MHVNARALFRTIAIAEAVSWAGLLIGMFFKYGPAHNPARVRVFGAIHGGVFVCYVLTVLLMRSRFRWDFRTFILAGLASIPPFFTAWFEVWADRAGLLNETPTSDESLVEAVSASAER